MKFGNQSRAAREWFFGFGVSLSADLSLGAWLISSPLISDYSMINESLIDHSANEETAEATSQGYFSDLVGLYVVRTGTLLAHSSLSDYDPFKLHWPIDLCGIKISYCSFDSFANI